MSKQNYFWRKNKQTNILQETEENITKNSYSQNCKDNSGFIQWEQGAIKGSNQKIRESRWKTAIWQRENFVDAKYSAQSGSASPWL